MTRREVLHQAQYLDQKADYLHVVGLAVHFLPPERGLPSFPGPEYRGLLVRVVGSAKRKGEGEAMWDR